MQEIANHNKAMIEEQQEVTKSVEQDKNEFDSSLLEDILKASPDDDLFPGIRRPSAPSIAVLKAMGSPILEKGSGWDKSPEMLIECLVFIGVHHLPWNEVISSFRDRPAFEARVLTEYQDIPFDRLKDLPQQIISMLRKETETQVKVVEKDEGEGKTEAGS